jgi:hypothetical protein
MLARLCQARSDANGCRVQAARTCPPIWPTASRFLAQRQRTRQNGGGAALRPGHRQPLGDSQWSGVSKTRIKTSLSRPAPAALSHATRSGTLRTGAPSNRHSTW